MNRTQPNSHAGKTPSEARREGEGTRIKDPTGGALTDREFPQVDDNRRLLAVTI